MTPPDDPTPDEQQRRYEDRGGDDCGSGTQPTPGRTTHLPTSGVEGECVGKRRNSRLCIACPARIAPEHGEGPDSTSPALA